jgi:hypothetical protein
MEVRTVNPGENGLVINLVDALLGAITPNFRAVLLRLDADQAALTFLLERESAADRAEIDDIVFEFQAIEPTLPLQVSIIVDSASLTKYAHLGRMVFARKEQE